MLRCARNRSRQKEEHDPLMEMLNELRRGQEFDRMHKTIPFDNNYFEKLEEHFNKNDGLHFYDSYEQYLNYEVFPYLRYKKIDIGDLK